MKLPKSILCSCPAMASFVVCALPRAKPTADGVCHFRAQYGAWSGDTMNMYLAYCRRIVNDYSLSGRMANPTM